MDRHDPPDLYPDANGNLPDAERLCAWSAAGSNISACRRSVFGACHKRRSSGSSKLEAAKCLDEVITAAVPDTQVGPDNALDVAVLRAQVYAAETAQAAAEHELAKEAFGQENAAAVTSSTMKELAETRRKLKISKKIAARYRHDAETMSAVVEQHKELYQRMETRVKAAEDSVQWLSSQLARERETFKAAVASNTAQSRRLHNLLSASSVADVSAEAQLRRCTEDLQEHVKRLITANRTLRARVKLEEMDPDTLALLDWNLLDLSDETRSVVRDALKAADASRSADEISDDVARAVFLVSALPSEMSRKNKLRNRVSDSDSSVQESPSDPKKSGDAKAAVPDAPASLVASTSQPLQRSEVPSPASNSDRQGCKSPLLRSQSASKVSSRALSRDAPRVSSPFRGGAGASSCAASRAASRASSPDRGCVIDLSGKVPPAARSTFSSTCSGARGSGGVSPALLVSTLQDIHSSPTSHPPRSLPALSSDESLATLELSDDDVEIVDVLPAVPPPSPGSRGDASFGSVTGDTDAQRRGPVLRSKAASSEFRSALLLEALEADNDDVLGLTELSPASSQSTSRTQAGPPAAPTTRSSSSRGASNGQVKVPAASITRSASSRGVSRKQVKPPAAPTLSTSSRGVSSKQVKPPAAPGRHQSTTRTSRPSSQVVATLSSMLGSDRRSQRPLPPSWCCQVLGSHTQLSPAVSGASENSGSVHCGYTGSVCGLHQSQSPVAASPQKSSTASMLFDTTSFDPNCKASQRAPVPLRLRGYWRMFRGFGNETDAAMEFALWERDHWVPTPTRAVEAYFEVAYRALEDAFDEASRPALRSSVDAAEDRWLAYVRERAQRSDRLRQN
ncbi:unnamed protein product [Phytophthora fragariaefolia]|uniref:Unnamed protein product n=1 Tax=Phytophthora fragariaefolia TaxID=1490495 RepID=A0A9W6X0S6_9STRA|nr:unnamed protein product [Phytophthora fragariaefolia]